MTERKPADMTIETWVERQIRAAIERGDLDDLPGAGKPIPPTRADDELGWVRRKLESEGLPTDALLPLSLQLRREVDRLPRTLARIDPRTPGAEKEVRELVSDLNRRIAHWVRSPTPPVLPIAAVDADLTVRRWRAEQEGAPSAGSPGPGGPAGSGHSDSAGSPLSADSAGSGSAAGPAPHTGVTVYWRPGCVFCLRLRTILRMKRLRPTMVNIWNAPAAAAFVRSVAGGDETVPTVVIDGVAHVNPAPRTVVAALRRARG